MQAISKRARTSEPLTSSQPQTQQQQGQERTTRTAILNTLTVVDLTKNLAHPDDDGPRAETTTAPGDAMLRVLGDADFFPMITTFQDGWPRWVPRMALACDNYGYLVRYLIANVDLTALKRLYRLSRESSYYQDQERMQFEGAMELAVRIGKLDMVRWLHEIVRDQNGEFVMAALYGHDEIRQWLFENRPESYTNIDPTLMDALVRAGQLETMKWMDVHIIGAKYSSWAMAEAAISNRMDIVEYLQEHHPYACDAEALDRAFALASMEIIVFLHEHRSEVCTVSAMDGAAENGRFDVVRFLHENRTEGCSRRGLTYALENGHLEIAKFLQEHYNVTCAPATAWKAARNEHSDVVRYLFEHFPNLFTTTVIEEVAKVGDIEMVKLLSTRTTLSAGSALSSAAERGHLSIVKYLVENRRDGCLWKAHNYAIWRERTDVAAYLRPLVDPGVDHCGEENHSLGDEHPVCQLRSTAGR